MMEQAKRTRTAAKAQFTRMKKSLNDALNTPSVPASTLERRFEELKKKFDTLQDSHDSYTAFSAEMEDEESAALEQWIDELATEFDRLEIRTDEKIEQFKTSQAAIPQERHVKSPTTHNTSALKVERMKFPKFEGGIRRYPQFKEEFLRHVAPQYQTEQLAFVLKSYLNDEVREEVESCGEDYSAVWVRLDQRYGDRGRLVTKILDEVTHLQQGKNEDAFTLQMIKVVEKAHRDLARLNAEEEMYNATMIVTVERRMPTTMKQEWAKEVAGKDMSSKNKFLKLLECLQNWRCRIEYVSDDVRSTPAETKGTVFYQQEGRSNSNSTGDRRQRDGQSGTNSSGGTPARSKCWIHDTGSASDLHPIWRCKEFLGQSAEERLKLVKRYKACTICLLTTCPGATSPSNCNRNFFKCNMEGCGETHNRLLHVFQKVAGTSAHSDGDAATDSTILLTQ
jgi:hypothetical protein